MSEKSFESMMKELEEIASGLNAGNLPLDETMELFKRGMALCAECQSRLDSYEKQIRTVTEDSLVKSDD